MRKAKIIGLHRARVKYQELKKERDRIVATFEIANKPFFDQVAEAAKELQDLDATVRVESVVDYKLTGNKQPFPGVTIKLYTTIDYDANKAFEWAREHGIALRLDVKAFEAIAETNSKPDFVTVGKEPKATIATDLSKFALTVVDEVKE